MTALKRVCYWVLFGPRGWETFHRSRRRAHCRYPLSHVRVRP